jgi:hypothetical protein
MACNGHLTSCCHGKNRVLVKPQQQALRSNLHDGITVLTQSVRSGAKSIFMAAEEYRVGNKAETWQRCRNDDDKRTSAYLGEVRATSAGGPLSSLSDSSSVSLSPQRRDILY